MQKTDPNVDTQETDQESPPTPQEEGYAITIHVTKEGYEVTGPDPLPAEPQGEEQSESQPLLDLTSAIKHVLAIVKENPISQDEQTSFKSATQDMGQ